MLRLRTGNLDLDANTQALHDLIRALQAVPIGRGKQLDDLEFAAAVDVDVRHTLGRRVTGYLVVGITGAVTGGALTRSESDNESTFLRLNAVGYGATITASLWVY